MENIKCLFANFPWDLLWLLLLPLLLLWWWMNRIIDKYKHTVASLEDRINYLEGELDACKKAKVPAPAIPVPVAPIPAAPMPAPAALKKDDLKIVEGIGPKIEELFNAAGIFTFAQLASTAPARLKEILDAAGPRFQMHDPTTWPDQSAMARDGKWDELKKWQDELNKGKSA